MIQFTVARLVRASASDDLKIERQFPVMLLNFIQFLKHWKGAVKRAQVLCESDYDVVILVSSPSRAPSLLSEVA